MSEKEMIPQGFYPAVAVPTAGDDGTHTVRWGRAGEKKTNQALVYFEILEGPHAEQRLPWFGFFSRQSYERTLQAFRYMGWRGDDLMNPGPLDQKVQITVEHHTYNEKTYARVAWVNRLGQGAIKLNDPLTPDELRKFSSQMKSAFAKVPEVQSERAARNGNGHAKAAGRGPGLDDGPHNDDWSEQQRLPSGQDATPIRNEDDIPF